ncbi:piggyBac transposable element-derived protein 4-like isoform X2 [Gymnodraco acuticeps]|uniref:PiggyBac transposable element-derived protein 4-like isoform X2 n=1 Tax=Gymnodraco acuticeps TaxID=8218 RepID=A0A6P8X3L1_GYMAC|nr:piggyBac transposable element-derived protein 4-like isoform X2 [Gymnodraco acuticeps]
MCVCVDEQLVPFRGRCKFRQYIPSKPAKYRLKIWVTADVETSYAWKCQIYTGKAAGSAAKVGQGKRVVLEMTEGLQGITVTCDHFFTSYALVQELLKRKVALVGTIRRNKPELPSKLLQVRQRAALSSLFGFTKNTTAVSYIPKRGRNVLLLSSKHRDPAVTEEEKRKPVIIADYNHCKGAVDNLDKLQEDDPSVATGPLPQHDRCLCLHAFVLFTAVDPSWKQAKSFRRRLFLEELGRSLVSAKIMRRKHPPRTPAAVTIV